MGEALADGDRIKAALTASDIEGLKLLRSVNQSLLDKGASGTSKIEETILGATSLLEIIDSTDTEGDSWSLTVELSESQLQALNSARRLVRKKPDQAVGGVALQG